MVHYATIQCTNYYDDVTSICQMQFILLRWMNLGLLFTNPSEPSSLLAHILPFHFHFFSSVCNLLWIILGISSMDGVAYEEAKSIWPKRWYGNCSLGWTTATWIESPCTSSCSFKGTILFFCLLLFLISGVPSSWTVYYKRRSNKSTKSIFAFQSIHLV